MFAYLYSKLNKKPGNKNYHQGLHCHTSFSRN